MVSPVHRSGPLFLLKVAILVVSESPGTVASPTPLVLASGQYTNQS